MINFINFNQTGTCISIGTSVGFQIFNCDPFGKFYSNSEGGCSIVEMLFSTSLLAVVGVGDQPSMSPRRLRIINTKRHSVICEVTFPSTILAVKMNKSRLVVLLQDQIYIYDISNMRLLHTIETTSNPRGLIAMSPSLDNNYLAYPSPPKIINSEIKDHATTNNINISSSEVPLNQGLDSVTGLNNGKDNSSSITTNVNGVHTSNDSIGGLSRQAETEASPVVPTPNHNNGNSSSANNSIVKNGDVILFNMQSLQPTMVIEAHKGEIAALTLSKDGSLLATASEKGTIIRVFSVETGAKIYQFRRGTYPTKIYSLSFSDDNQFLAASSSSKTVHIFRLGKATASGEKPEVNNNSDIEEEEEDPYHEGEDECEIDNDEHEDALSTSNQSAISMDSANMEGASNKEPVVDASRRTVGRMIRKSSQKLSRRAAKTLGSYFPIKVTSILEPSRHFASLKLPVDSNSSVKTITAVGSFVDIDKAEYPELFEDSATAERQSTIARMLPVRVVSSEGFIYNYVLDPERGGDCLLLSQYSLLMD